jgi:DNA-binding GntR family transcriptional regulator
VAGIVAESFASVALGRETERMFRTGLRAWGAGSQARPIWAQVYDRLRDMIAAMSLEPGLALSEKTLAVEMRVSRTPVREALIRLSEEGLVDIYPQFGSFVAPIRMSAVLHAQFVRGALECALARAAAERGDRGSIAAVESIIVEQEKAVRTTDDAAFFELDERMHEALAIAAGQGSVWPIVQQSKIHLDRVRRLLLPADLKVRHLVGEHARILDAIVAGDAAGAADAMRRHLDGLQAGLQGLSRQHPDLFAERHERPAGRRPQTRREVS